MSFRTAATHNRKAPSRLQPLLLMPLARLRETTGLFWNEANERSEWSTGAERGEGVPASDRVGGFEGRSPSIKKSFAPGGLQQRLVTRFSGVAA